VFRQIRSKLLAAFAVPLAILVAVAGLAISSTLSQTRTAQDEREAVALAALGLAGALLGLLLVIRVSRAVSRPLADLASQAEQLATVSLPATVHAILEADATGGELPELPKVRAGNIEEVAGVATALDSLNKTAVELAAGQAALRRNLSDAFVNLGRRNQNLVTRQLEYITEVELKEADPTSLEELFRLDHLATRMRRNAESLLILAGSGPARQWSASVPVMDVARAASAEVEDYKRLRLHHFDPAMVMGIVTTDLVHILAELIENALSFSPPAAPVDVYGRFLEGGYVIVIVDSGIGMSSEDLATANQRLEGLGADGEVPGRYLGHFVAGRLAARHGIAISLQPSHSGGLVARVKVPAPLLEEAVADLSAGAEVKSAPSSVTNGPDYGGAVAPVLPEASSAVNEAALGLAASLAASTSFEDRSFEAPIEPETNGASSLDNGVLDDGYEEYDADGLAALDYEPLYNNGVSHTGPSGLDVESPAFDDGLGVVAGAGVTDLGAVWFSRAGDHSDENGASAVEIDDAVVEADAAGTYVKPFDWALPAEPPVAPSEATGTADVTTPSEPDGQTDYTPETFASQTGSFVATGYEEPVEPVAYEEYEASEDTVVQHVEPEHEIVAADVGPDEAVTTATDDDSFSAAIAEPSNGSYNGYGTNGSSTSDLATTGDILPGHGWASGPPEPSTGAPVGEALAAAVGSSPSFGEDRSSSYTPDLGASAPLATQFKNIGGNHFRPEPGSFDGAPLAGTAVAAAASRTLSDTASRDNGPAITPAAGSWSSSAPGPVASVVGPAAQARSTADALRKLTRRVPGASLPEEDDSLRRPTTMSTSRNPLGLSGALSQYLSVTVEGRPEKEHNAR
jgi:signal transduction histidine kinase